MTKRSEARPGVRLLAGLIALAVTGSFGLASRGAQAATGTVTASLVAAVSIAKTTDMNFGMAAAGATTGTVVLPASASPTRSFTGGAEIGSPLGMASAAFDVTGVANATYAITLPANATLSFSANSMTVNAFTSAPAGSGNVGSGGLQTVYVGGTLNVGVNQVQGAYAGTFNVTVAYN